VPSDQRGIKRGGGGPPCNGDELSIGTLAVPLLALLDNQSLEQYGEMAG
jgi:hypothetical protein